MPERTCSSCGFLLDDAHSFCPSCGARTEPSRAGDAPPGSDEESSRRRLQEAVGDDYRIGRLIGKGGFAEVFEAHDARLYRRVAIKVVRPDLPVSTQLLARFQREARAVAGLRHPNVMEIYTVGERDGVAYFVMPLIEGESLAERIVRGGPLPLPEARRILIEAANALEVAHRSGTVHRDVKPDNILLEGEEGRVLIADFGIAKALGEGASAFTGSGVFVGTPRYMSPEQASGDAHDHRSDIYSLGVVAFEMVTGEPPFAARSVQALIAKHLTERAPLLWTLRSECPERLARVVDRCLAKDPGNRWDSLAEMVLALEGTAPLRTDSTGIGAPGSAQGRARPLTGDAGAGSEMAGRGGAPVRSFRRGAGAVGVGLAILIIADLVLGIGGLSAWVAVGAGVYLAARAARLWNAGYEWFDLFRSTEQTTAEQVITGETHKVGPHDEGFGRFGSLVRACTADRATIIRSFAQLPHQVQKRFPMLRETVEGLAGRVKHLARKVGTLEERIAESTARSERQRADGPGPDAELAGASLERHAARLQELNSAREEAAGELRACVSHLEELRDTFTARARLDPALAMEELARTLSKAAEHLGSGPA